MAIPNLDEYNKKKAKGLVSLHDTGDGELFAVVTKKFDAVDGVALPSEVSGVYLKEVDEALAKAQSELDALNAFRTEMLVAKPMGVAELRVYVDGNVDGTGGSPSSRLHISK